MWPWGKRIWEGGEQRTFGGGQLSSSPPSGYVLGYWRHCTASLSAGGRTFIVQTAIVRYRNYCCNFVAGLTILQSSVVGWRQRISRRLCRFDAPTGADACVYGTYKRYSHRLAWMSNSVSVRLMLACGRCRTTIMALRPPLTRFVWPGSIGHCCIDSARSLSLSDFS